MSNIPKGFGFLKFDAAKVGPSKVPGARPESKKDQNKLPPVATKASKKRDITKVAVEKPGAPKKCPKTNPESSSLLTTELSSPAAAFIKDEDVKKWKSLSPEKENHALIQASAQLLISSLGRAERLEKEGAHLKKAEARNLMLSKQVADMEQEHKKISAQNEVDIRILQKEVDDYVEISNHLNGTIDKLNKENSDLKSRQEELAKDQENVWKEEKAKIQDENFAQGFRFYATGFLANDPDYDFTKFGEETVQWIKKFKVDEADAIRARRIELGLEEAVATPLGAPNSGNTEDDEFASFIQTPLGEAIHVTPLQVDASRIVHPAQYQGAPNDMASPQA